MGNIEELVETLARDATPVKQAPHPFMLGLAWLAGAGIYLAVSILISGLRPDLAQKLHEPWFDAEIASLFLLFIATSLSAAVLAFPDMHQMKPVALAPAGAFALFATVLFFAWRADTPPAPLPVHSFECTISITLLSLLPAAWALFSVRKFASTHYRWASSSVLLSAFSVGALWLRLHEINNSVIHVLEWHYLPMLGIGFVGWWLGKFLLKW